MARWSMVERLTAEERSECPHARTWMVRVWSDRQNQDIAHVCRDCGAFAWDAARRWEWEPLKWGDALEIVRAHGDGALVRWEMLPPHPVVLGSDAQAARVKRLERELAEARAEVERQKKLRHAEALGRLAAAYWTVDVHGRVAPDHMNAELAAAWRAGHNEVGAIRCGWRRELEADQAVVRALVDELERYEDAVVLGTDFARGEAEGFRKAKDLLRARVVELPGRDAPTAPAADPAAAWEALRRAVDLGAARAAAVVDAGPWATVRLEVDQERRRQVEDASERDAVVLEQALKAGTFNGLARQTIEAWERAGSAPEEAKSDGG